MPTGVQIAGQTYDDLTPFRIDAALEEARPPLETPGAEATPPRLLTGA